MARSSFLTAHYTKWGRWREGGWRWKCCWDAEETVIQAAEREGLTHMSAHTRTLRDTEREVGTQDSTHQPRHQWPDQNTGAWPDHRGPEWHSRPPGARESQQRPMDGGADVAAWLRLALAWLGWRLSLVWPRVGTLRQCPHSPPGSRCPSHRGQTSVRRDTHWPHQAVTLTNPRSRGRDTPSLVSVVAKQKANVFEWSQIEAGWSLNRFIMVIRNSNQSNTIIKLT